jgi:protein involved in polysaccharide export with SLBB domain
MTRLLRLILILALSMMAAGGAAQVPGAGEDYTLNAGDTIRIHVYGEEDLTFQQLLVGPNGRISYPFLGELQVAGESVAQLQQMLVKGLRPDYLIDPRISVSIVRYRPFFVNGEVQRPGGLDFQPGLTLRKAVSLAGGFTERANSKQMLVIADNDPSREEKKVGLDYSVHPGDIITVQDTFF